jgi:hypothetical protein
MNIEEKILYLPILGKCINRQSPLFCLLVNNDFLISRASSILKSLEPYQSLHKKIIKECISEESVESFRDKLAKYHVAIIFGKAGCKINEIELKNKKGSRRTDIECEYDNKILLIEVKHINITSCEQEVEKEAFNEDKYSYDIPSRKGPWIPLPCNDPSINSVTEDSVEIKKFY